MIFLCFRISELLYEVLWWKQTYVNYFWIYFLGFQLNNREPIIFPEFFFCWKYFHLENILCQTECLKLVDYVNAETKRFSVKQHLAAIKFCKWSHVQKKYLMVYIKTLFRGIYWHVIATLRCFLLITTQLRQNSCLVVCLLEPLLSFPLTTASRILYF